MFSLARWWRLAALLIFSTFATFELTGCAGESNSLPPAEARPAPDPVGPPQDPENSPEFKKNDGLDIVNAEAAYIRGATGAGVNVAVIDTGFDADHPDLANNISAASYNIVSNSSDVADGADHGTKVAGVIAAERNGLGSHGVAYDASILAVKAARCNSKGCLFYMADLAKAVNYATDNMAHVINMSLGGPVSGDSDLNAAIRRAANAGAFVVAAAGNYSASEPIYPARLAAKDSYAGMVVAVVAVSDSGEIAYFSNECGTAMNSCLAAPGISVVTTKDGATDATQTTRASGTSFATPFVSGALALLIQLYPDAYAADPTSITMFMFDGALDLGDAGIDATYGHGLLDLEGAIDTADLALAAAILPLSSGAGATLSDSSIVLSPSFGDALGGLALLDSAIAVIQLSDGAHPYRARLDDRVSLAPVTSRLAAMLAGPGATTLGRPLGDDLSLAVAVSGGALVTGPNDPVAGELHGMQLTGSLGDATNVRLGIDVTAQGRAATAAGASSLFLSAGDAVEPLAGLAGRGNSLGVDSSIGDRTTLSLGRFEGETEDLLADGTDSTRLDRLSLTRDFHSGGAVRLDLGLLAESNSLLGSQGSGAFSTESGASTRYLTFSGSLPVGANLELLGSATMAATRTGNTAGGILRDWDTAHSNAFSIGVISRNILGDDDRIGLLVGQPLRVYHAEATLAVPVALDGDGEAILRSERVALTPSGREIDIEFAYDRKLAPGMVVSSWLLLQFEPGHVAGAEREMIAGMKFNVEF